MKVMNYMHLKMGKIIAICGIMIFVGIVMVSAQDGNVQVQSEPATPPFSIGKVFTFLFMTLGPLKIIAPFAKMTRGRDRAFKRKLAALGTLLAAIAIVVAATTGAKTLIGWGVSVDALLLAAGIILFLIALQPVLEQYKPKKSEVDDSKSSNSNAASISALALSPLTFPTIITPYGVAVLILLATLRSNHLPEIAGVMAVILVLNFLAMLFADFILKSAVVSTVLGVIGTVMGVLQVALGVQVVVDALRMLGAL